jgi:hypothetical protein
MCFFAAKRKMSTFASRALLILYSIFIIMDVLSLYLLSYHLITHSHNRIRALQKKLSSKSIKDANAKKPTKPAGAVKRHCDKLRADNVPDAMKVQASLFKGPLKKQYEAEAALALH